MVSHLATCWRRFWDFNWDLRKLGCVLVVYKPAAAMAVPAQGAEAARAERASAVGGCLGVVINLGSAMKYRPSMRRSAIWPAWSRRAGSTSKCPRSGLWLYLSASAGGLGLKQTVLLKEAPSLGPSV